MGRSLTVSTFHCSPQVLAMNASRGRRQEAAGPKGRRAHRPREQDRDVQLSKALSYALRHGALKLGLPMGPGPPPRVIASCPGAAQALHAGATPHPHRSELRTAAHPGLITTIQTPQTPAPIVYSGMRPNCEVAVFINGPLALADGIPFFRSANGVILTPGNADGVLPPKYFKEALQLRPTRKPLSLAGNEETECQSDPKHSSRGRRMTQQ
ncbi:tRNA 2'-phosphotransferase 1 isoform X3 [Delphinapterus leucas]|uniref:tRNA 2'-phosphotransferase 1 isoform X3 n=1 Tax=Delphinapterus leucas TaxID=9749 RepID=A0A2Y9PKD3_DELLE|nr:tRNA 2'-phosphotransferase 1 isoform X3 [Delphinapterus leucas]